MGYLLFKGYWYTNNFIGSNIIFVLIMIIFIVLLFLPYRCIIYISISLLFTKSMCTNKKACRVKVQNLNYNFKKGLFKRHYNNIVYQKALI